VMMYLTPETNEATLRDVASLATGSTLAATFIIPLDLVEADERSGLQGAAKGARAAGTPFVSFYTPAAMLQLARAAGFRDVEHVSPEALNERYFAARTDGLRLSSGEQVLVATT
jgi:O-methyltransferase involved in polyketide biosynthesis